MAAPKGHPRYGGRTKGTPNKRSLNAIEIVRNCGTDPLEVLCDLMKNSDDQQIQVQAAKAVAEYVHIKKQQHVQISGSITHELQQKIQELQQLTDAELDEVIDVEVKKLNGRVDDNQG